MDKPRRRYLGGSSKLLMPKTKALNTASPIPKSQKPKGSRSPLLRSKAVLADSAFIEEALRKSIELLEAVQAVSGQKQSRLASSQRSISPIERPLSAMCNSSTQTTEDKSTQVTLTSPTFRTPVKPSAEIKSLKQSLRSISDRLRDLSSPYMQSSGTAGILTFRSPEDRTSFGAKRSSFVSSVNGPLLSDKKTSPATRMSPGETPQGLHLSSLELATHSSCEDPQAKRLLDIMDELELS